LVPDHVLGDVHRHELAAVVHGQRVPDHLRDDRRAARPRLDHALFVRPVHRLHLLEERRVDEGTLLERAAHYFGLRWTMNLSLGFRPRVLYPLVGTPHGDTGCRPPEVLPSPPPSG